MTTPAADWQRTRESDAYHEAGHVVIQSVLGFSIEKVTILPNAEENYAGRTWGPDPIYGYHGSGKRERIARVRDYIVGCTRDSPPNTFSLASRSRFRRLTGRGAITTRRGNT